MQKKLGIIAGSGKLPEAVAARCAAEKRPYVILAFDGQTEKSWLAPHPHDWVALGQVQHLIDVLKRGGVEEIVMIGGFKRPSFFGLKVDARGAKLAAKLAMKSLGDDGLLRVVIDEFEKEGFGIVGVHTILPELLAPMGAIAGGSPDSSALADISKGVEVLKELSPKDLGQGAVIKSGAVIATESEDGTDKMLKLAAKAGKGGILVKARKIGQENRVDLPTIGPKTVLQAAEAGLSGIAVEAEGSLIVEREATAKLAEQHRIFIYGFRQ